MANGTIRKLMESYGFIKTEEGKDFFFHRNELDGVDFSNLKVEQEVEFEIEKDSKGRSQASKVRLVEPQADADVGDVGDTGGGDIG